MKRFVAAVGWSFVLLVLTCFVAYVVDVQSSRRVYLESLVDEIAESPAPTSAGHPFSHSGPQLTISDLQWRVTSRNDIYHAFAYQFSIHNGASVEHPAIVEVQLLDADGFVVAGGFEHLTLPPGATREIKGSCMAPTEQGQMVRTATTKFH